MNLMFKTRQEINQQIKKIPKKNRSKFYVDYIKLIHLAQQEDYENFNLDGR